MANVIYSMTVSVDGFVTDRSGGLEWSVPDEELFRFHLARTKELAGHLQGRRLYEAMLVWETDPAFRETELEAEFADVWTALPKVVLSRTLGRPQPHARAGRGQLAARARVAGGGARRVRRRRRDRRCRAGGGRDRARPRRRAPRLPVPDRPRRRHALPAAAPRAAPARPGGHHGVRLRGGPRALPPGALSRRYARRSQPPSSVLSRRPHALCGPRTLVSGQVVSRSLRLGGRTRWATTYDPGMTRQASCGTTRSPRRRP